MRVGIAGLIVMLSQPSTTLHLLLHSGMMMFSGKGKDKKILPLLLSAWVALCLDFGAAFAAEQTGLSIDTHQQVIYCAVQWSGDRDRVVQALQAGVNLSFNWTIQVSRVRDYWMNDGIAKITFSRRVQPDLLTRTWLLEDSASGISRRALSLSDAVDFLTTIREFPVLDKALLASGETYEMTVSAEKIEGEMGQTWWSRLWKQSVMQMQLEFSLP